MLNLILIFAAMVELVDTLVLGTSAFGRVGSSPSRGTKKIISLLFCYS